MSARLRRSGLRAALVVAALCCAAAAPAYGADATLTEAGDATFPERAWILTLPDATGASTPDVGVGENGRPVTDLRVRPANAAGSGGFGVVLAIDTSKSMTGAPIRDAMAAAREFAAQRPAGQRLAVVTFNERTSVLLRPTTDAGAIDAALAGTPTLAPGTHIYDGTAAALKLLRDSGQRAGAVVVLSDGADRGSVATPAAVAAAADDARARIFTVSAGSVAAGAPALRELSERTSGTYLGSAEGEGLAAVYRKLGGQLASAYLVTYRSLVPAGRRVQVSARAGDAKATARYRAPALSVAGGPGRKTGFLATDAGIALVSFAALLAAFLLISHLLLLRRDRGGVRERVHRYGLPEGADGAVAPLPEDEPSGRPGSARRAAAQASLAESLDIARLGISPQLYLAIWIGGGILLSLFAVAFSGTLLMLPVAAAGAFLAGRAYLSAKVERQRALFADQLADGLQAVASAMRTGHSFAGGLSALVEEAPEPTATEFTRVIADERIGIPLEQAFEQTIRRMDNRDLEQVALVAVLQRETGGNGAEALDRVVENLRGREEVRRLVRTLTAQGRLSRWVLTGLPVFLLLALSFLGDGYARPLFETTIGNVLLVLGTALVIAGSLVIKRLVQIRV